MVDQVMARKEISPLYEYWKAPMVTDKDISAYHDAGWLLEVMVYTPLLWIFPLLIEPISFVLSHRS
jgi:hypothetical protein